MTVYLLEDEKLAFAARPKRTIEEDRYPLSPRTSPPQGEYPHCEFYG